MGRIISPHPITGWRGLNERRLLNGDPTETSDLDNVRVRNGVVSGRLGMGLYASGDSGAASDILGTWQYYRSGTAAGNLIRMTATTLEYKNGTSWSNITGTALAAGSIARPQAVTMGEIDTWICVNEGYNRPRKWTGTGNSAELGGTPPYAKAIEQYVGFLALGNISLNGSTFFPLDVILSDDPDGTWVECDDTEIYVTTLTLDESPGEVRALRVLGLEMLAYKADAIVAIRFTGGVTRFSRRKLDFPMGILAPLSLVSVGKSRHIFLASDKNLYITDGQIVEPLPPAVQRSLKDVADATAPFLRATYVDECYELFYPRTSSNPYLNGRISYNVRTGEWTRSVYPVEVISPCSFRPTYDGGEVLIASATSSSGDLTYQLDTGTDDAITGAVSNSVSRYFTVDWGDLGQSGTKYITGAELTFNKAKNCRVKVSISVDKSSKYQYPKYFDLRGNDPDETITRVSYTIPSPVWGTYFKFRIDMFQDSTQQCELLDFTPEVIPTSSASLDTPALPQPSRI